MASVVLGVAGAAVGSMFGMPGVGYMIGSAIGSALFPPPGQNGPRMSDLKVQSSQYGSPIPIPYGTYRLAGQVLWAADLVEHANDGDSGSGGGGPTTYTYTCSFAVLLCEGVLRGVRRIWADNKLIYDVTVDSLNEQVMFKAGGYKLYVGTSDQLPDPTIEAHKGVGNVPGYTGRAYWVFTDLELGTFGNRLPNLTFEVVTKGVKADVLVPPIPLGRGTDLVRDPFTGHIWSVYTVEVPGPPPHRVGVIDIYDSETAEVLHSIGLGLDGDTMNIINALGVMWVGGDDNSYTSGTVLTKIHPTSYEILREGDTNYAGAVTHLGHVAVNGTSLSLSVTNVIGSGTINFADEDSTIAWNSTLPYVRWPKLVAGFARTEWIWCSLNIKAQGRTCWAGYGNWLDITDDSGVLATVHNPAWTGTPQSHRMLDLGAGRMLWAVVGEGKTTIAVVNVHLNTVDTFIDLADLPEAHLSATAVYYSPDTDTVYVDTSTGFTGSPSVYSFDGTTGAYKEAFPAQHYAVGQRLGTSIYVGNETFFACESTSSPSSRAWKVAFALPITLDPNKVMLKDIVYDISMRTNELAPQQVDVSQLTDLVNGYCITNNMNARAAIEPLAQAYFFGSVESDSKVKFVKRGGQSIATIQMNSVVEEGQ